MTCPRAAGALLLLGALFALAACDNPTNVGDELVGGEDAGPERVVLRPGAGLDVDTARYAPETGTSVPGEIDVARFLAGQQEAGAPLGNVEATGYFDVGRIGAPSELDALTIDSVTVDLVVNYAYGSTSEPITVSLHDLAEEWEANNAPADTTFDSGFAERQTITTFSAAPGDTLSVSLPQRWIREHESELRTVGDTAFGGAFHGFQVRAAGGSGVVGFASSSTRMRVIYESPSGQEERPIARYRLTEQLTTVRSSGRASSDDQRALVQDGIGRALSIELAPPDSLRGVAVNNATLVLEADTAASGLPETFMRPTLEQLELRNGPDDDEGDDLPRGRFLTFNEEEARFESNFALRNVVQPVLNDAADFGEIQLRPPPRLVQVRRQNIPVPVPSLNSALIRLDEGHEPRLELVYTPINEE